MMIEGGVIAGCVGEGILLSILSTISFSNKLLSAAFTAAFLICSSSGMVSSTNTVTPSPCKLFIEGESSDNVIGQLPGWEAQASLPDTGIGGVMGHPCPTGGVPPPTQFGMAAIIGMLPSRLSFSRLRLIRVTIACVLSDSLLSFLPLPIIDFMFEIEEAMVELCPCKKHTTMVPWPEGALNRYFPVVLFRSFPLRSRCPCPS